MFRVNVLKGNLAQNWIFKVMVQGLSCSMNRFMQALYTNTKALATIACSTRDFTKHCCIVATEISYYWVLEKKSSFEIIQVVTVRNIER